MPFTPLMCQLMMSFKLLTELASLLLSAANRAVDQGQPQQRQREKVSGFIKQYFRSEGTQCLSTAFNWVPEELRAGRKGLTVIEGFAECHTLC